MRIFKSSPGDSNVQQNVGTPRLGSLETDSGICGRLVYDESEILKSVRKGRIFSNEAGSSGYMFETKNRSFLMSQTMTNSIWIKDINRIK